MICILSWYYQRHPIDIVATDEKILFNLRTRELSETLSRVKILF